MTLLPHLSRIPPEIVTVADYEHHARERLPASVLAYLAGNAGDGITARANRAAFDSLALVPRVLRPMSGGSTATTLLGRAIAHPVLLAPVAFQRLFHPDGEVASARAAEAMDTIMTLSTLSSIPMEQVAKAATGPKWFQLYVQPDRGLTRELVARAKAAGYEALVVTVDAPLSGIRDAEQRSGFALPSHISAAHFPEGRVPPPLPAAGHPIFDGMLGRAATWADLKEVTAEADLPVIVKGILSADDAKRCVAVGAKGVVVSNHGGRVLDTVVPSAAALPRVVSAVNGEADVLLDGGIRRGTDVLKALALGANGVMVGQPCALALATAGALGVAHAIKLLVEEFAAAMALCGCRTVPDIGPALIHLS